jgi:hypothetical protein
MLKIDHDFLKEIGLAALPSWEANAFLKYVYETLETRVGQRLAARMSTEQLDEFEEYFERKDDAGAFQWLEANFPGYKEIVQAVFDELKLEVTRLGPEIVAISASD